MLFPLKAQSIVLPPGILRIGLFDIVDRAPYGWIGSALVVESELVSSPEIAQQEMGAGGRLPGPFQVGVVEIKIRLL